MATGLETQANLFGQGYILLAASETDQSGSDATHETATDAGTHTEVLTEIQDTEHGETGMPQLNFGYYPNQIFWLVLCLIAVYFLLSRIALPRIGGTIEQRAQTIQRDLDRAAEMKLKAEEAEQQYNQALADARGRAHEIAEQTKAKIQGELDQATAKADAEIAKQSDASAKRIAQLQTEAASSVQDVATDVAKAILDKLAPQASDDKAIKAAIDKVLKG